MVTCSSFSGNDQLSALAKERVGSRNPFYGKQHSEEAKKIIAEKMKGRLPPNTNRISVNGVLYNSQSEAARSLGVSVATITFRLKSNNPKYSNYFVVRETSDV